MLQRGRDLRSKGFRPTCRQRDGRAEYSQKFRMQKTTSKYVTCSGNFLDARSVTSAVKALTSESPSSRSVNVEISVFYAASRHFTTEQR